MKADTMPTILAEEARAAALATIAASASAAEIIAAARPYLESLDVMEAAHAALATIWPGFFSCSNALRRALLEAETAEALQVSPLRLIPTTVERMRDGHAHLAATFGLAGVVGTVCQGEGGKDRAANFTHVFRIEPVQL